MHNEKIGDNYITPPWIAEKVKEVFAGQLDLDPASNERANKVIKATEVITEEQNGILTQWHGNIYLNPPYSQPLCDQFTNKFMLGDYRAGILLCNFDCSTNRCQLLLHTCQAVCLLKKRVSFLDPKNLKPLAGNRHSQALFFNIGMCPHWKAIDYLRRFITIFSESGFVMAL